MKQDKNERKINKGRGSNRVKTEKIVMLASAALIMSALTATGIYMRGNQKEEIKIDLSGTEERIDQLAEDMVEDQKTAEKSEKTEQNEEQIAFQVTDSGKSRNAAALYENATETDDSDVFVDTNSDLDFDPEYEEVVDIQQEVPEETENVVANAVNTVARELHFQPENGITLPVTGQVLMNYSMDKTAYFVTLDQYKYQPGMVIQSTEGETVASTVEATVKAITQDPVLGTCLKLDLGDGYELILGQLKDLQVEEGDWVEKGQILGFVAAPTKYYSEEGTNLYVQVNKDDSPVNPMTLEP